MPRYAAGKYAKGISDRSGRAYPLRSMLLEWNGSLVGPDEYESKQPQLEPRRVRADPQSLRVSRPARTEPAVEVLLPFNSFKSGSSGSAVITVNEISHGRSTGDIVRFRSVEAFDGFTEAVLEGSSGYTITKVDDNNYTFTASSGTATTGNVKGGGGFASAGPVTVSA
jgi:hypothetical protein